MTPAHEWVRQAADFNWFDWVTFGAALFSIALAIVAIVLTPIYARKAKKSSDAIELQVTAVAKLADSLDRSLVDLNVRVQQVATVADVLDRLLEKTIDIIGQSHSDLEKHSFKTSDHALELVGSFLTQAMRFATWPASAQGVEQLEEHANAPAVEKQEVISDMADQVSDAVQQLPRILQSTVRERFREALRARGGQAPAGSLVDEVAKATGETSLALAVGIQKMRADGEVNYDGELMRKTIVSLPQDCSA